MGHQAEHVLDLGLQEADDAKIWMHASETGSVVVSKDDDFFLLVNRPNDTGLLLWVRLGNCRSPALLARFTQVWPAIESAFVAGQRVVELR
jgi:predicted nuclease of predicted toxin-antitoxin system